MPTLDVTSKFSPSRGFTFDIDIAKAERPAPVGALVLASNLIHVRPFTLPAPLTVNKISVRVVKGHFAELWGFGIFSADGSTKLFNVVIAPIRKGLLEATVASVALSAGPFLFAWTSSGRESETYLDLEAELAGEFLLGAPRVGSAGLSSAAVMPNSLFNAPEAVTGQGVPVVVLSS